MKNQTLETAIISGITVETLCENEDGSTTVTVDLSDTFKDWYMFTYGLKKWDEDHFQRWFLNTLDHYLGTHEKNNDSRWK